MGGELGEATDLRTGLQKHPREQQVYSKPELVKISIDTAHTPLTSSEAWLDSA